MPVDLFRNREKEVLDAVDAIIRNREVLVPESLPKGCEIEYVGDEKPAEE